MDSSTALGRLEDWFKSVPGTVVAFSGGVDSAVVLALAKRFLPDAAVFAVTADSPSLSRRELSECIRLAAQMDARHSVIETGEMGNELYRKNDENRCYFCKGELYETLAALPETASGFVILNGSNADDVGDWRPGMRAAKEAGVRSPLLECGIGKEGVRALARHLGLDVAEKPSSPCLSSRIPYNDPIDVRRLSQVEQAEDFLRSEGFMNVRVRHYGDLARIEVPADQIPLLDKEFVFSRVRLVLLDIGFAKVEIDPEGLVSGKLNRAIGKLGTAENSTLAPV